MNSFILILVPLESTGVGLFNCPNNDINEDNNVIEDLLSLS